MKRRYRPFLIYNPRLGWAFYVNRAVSPYTTRSIGNPESRKVMRDRVGWFKTPQLAALFERTANRA